MAFGRRATFKQIPNEEEDRLAALEESKDKVVEFDDKKKGKAADMQSRGSYGSSGTKMTTVTKRQQDKLAKIALNTLPWHAPIE